MADNSVAALPEGWGMSGRVGVLTSPTVISPRKAVSGTPVEPLRLPDLSQCAAFLSPSQRLWSSCARRRRCATTGSLSSAAVLESSRCSKSERLAEPVEILNAAIARAGSERLQPICRAGLDRGPNTLASVKTLLAAQGIDPLKVNFLPIPVTLPLNMGYTVNDDTSRCCCAWHCQRCRRSSMRIAPRTPSR